ncbi:MAG: histidine kinase dimerization/phospho-acceptor domain-containing protein [Gammaproteobacteria bacterium]
MQELNRLLARLDRAFSIQRAFIADAAHELRSPLTAVRLQLQLLDRATDESATHEARAHLGEAVDRAAHLIEQLLTLARNEPRDAPSGLGPISLEAPAIEAIADTHALAQSRDIDVELRSQAGAQVAGDAAALRTLMRNLIDKRGSLHAEHGKVRVNITNSERGAALEGHRHGPWHPRSRSGTRVRPLLPPRGRPRRRQRARARHRQGHRRASRSHDHAWRRGRRGPAGHGDVSAAALRFI